MELWKRNIHPFVNVIVYKSWSLGEIYPSRRSTLPGEYKSAKLEWYIETGPVPCLYIGQGESPHCGMRDRLSGYHCSPPRPPRDANLREIAIPDDAGAFESGQSFKLPFKASLERRLFLYSTTPNEWRVAWYTPALSHYIQDVVLVFFLLILMCDTNTCRIDELKCVNLLRHTF